MTFASVCSGIEAPSVAWGPLGWCPLWFSEIEPFCCSLLSQRYPEVKLYGDFTKIESPAVPTVLMGGTPCQSLSVAGKRAGLDDPRGNLTLEYIRLAKRLGVRWLVWENVQGALSHDRGGTFEAILGALAQCGYGFAYRVFDAQYDGLAQRRKRVFVVGYLGDWRPPAAVLFERESLRRDTSPSRETGEASAGGSGEGSRDRGASTYVNCDARTKVDSIARPLKSDTGSGGRGCVLAFDVKQSGGDTGEQSPTLRATPHASSHANGGGGIAIAQAAAVRRLTPLEWERLQGFPDGYTAITYRGKPAKDGPRYKAIGNSISIPTLRWIGERIGKVEKILQDLRRE